MDPRRVRVWHRAVNDRRIERFASEAAERAYIQSHPLSPPSAPLSVIGDGIVFVIRLDSTETRVAINPRDARYEGAHRGLIPYRVQDALVALCYRAGRQQNRRR